MYPEIIPNLTEEEWKELEEKLKEFSLSEKQIKSFVKFKKNNNRGKELAEAHWSYIENILITHAEDEDLIDIIAFHYKTAMEHGYKHGIEEKE